MLSCLYTFSHWPYGLDPNIDVYMLITLPLPTLTHILFETVIKQQITSPNVYAGI